ncbi:MAG: low molecular weight phosphotyrosine protein phosphatase [Clostridia bacterium]|nr:low molecular weight phosphotyrosine protein phosphatase [Clostridia bacterium]
MKIMFVCHGNICRSPMAEFVMRDLLRKNGLSERVQVCSSATSTEEIWNGVGNPVYPPARRELVRHGVPLDEGKRAVQLRREDYDKYDLFVGMDSANIRNMHRMLGGDPAGKICKLLSFAGRDADVADPWYTGDFAATWRDVWEGCNALLNTLDVK